jgi:serine/threonine-protein kinase
MPQRQVVERAIEDIADGTTVDWDALARDAGHDELELLKYLRLLGSVAQLHQSGSDAPQPRGIAASADSDATTDSLSEPWGRYRLKARIGEGSFGRVYLAWDPELEREIAIKILHNKVTDSELRQRLTAEGRALARVRHANVVSVYGLEAHGDRVGLCMEFVQGETLDSVVRSHGTLNAREAGVVGEDVCRALAAVHAAGFVHRDVKSRNVMRDRTGRIVLMDFGTGRETAHLRQGAVVDTAGTPMYMAPEVLAGLPASESSDVYSVAVLLYYLVTGEYPVEGRSIEELRAAHMQGRRHLLSDRRSDLPMTFIQVVERALAPDARQRYASAGALLEDLAKLALRVKLSPLQYIIRSALAVAAAVTLVTILGMLSSRVLNARLERSAFVTEGVRDWFIWGARSFLLPVVLFLVIVAGVGLAAVLRYILLALSKSVRRFDEKTRERLLQLVQRLRLDDVTVLASSVLLLSTAALLSAWFIFAPLIDALGQNVSNAPAEGLALLAPDYRCSSSGCQPVASAYFLNFRTMLIWILSLSVFGWFLVSKLAAIKGQTLNRGVACAGAVVMLLGTAILSYPFRMLYDTTFPAVMWNGADCYLLGERQDDRLLFCPELTPSRIRIVGREATLTRTGVTESMFTRFAKPGGGPRPTGQ